MHKVKHGNEVQGGSMSGCQTRACGGEAPAPGAIEAGGKASSSRAPRRDAESSSRDDDDNALVMCGVCVYVCSR